MIDRRTILCLASDRPGPETASADNGGKRPQAGTAETDARDGEAVLATSLAALFDLFGGTSAIGLHRSRRGVPASGPITRLDCSG
jgi:hypothetical protein